LEDVDSNIAPAFVAPPPTAGAQWRYIRYNRSKTCMKYGNSKLRCVPTVN